LKIKDELIPMVRHFRGHPHDERLQRGARMNAYTLLMMHKNTVLQAWKTLPDFNIGHNAQIICLGDLIEYDEYFEYHLLNGPNSKKKKRKKGGKKRKKGKKKKKAPVEEE
jgi:hypothetical protein